MDSKYNNVVVRCNHCMHMTPTEDFEEPGNPESCPNCGKCDALMDLSVDDICHQNNAPIAARERAVQP